MSFPCAFYRVVFTRFPRLRVSPGGNCTQGRMRSSSIFKLCTRELRLPRWRRSVPEGCVDSAVAEGDAPPRPTGVAASSFDRDHVAHLR
jgi:hypothetical protein